MKFPAKDVEYAMDKLGELLNFLSGDFFFVCYEIDLQLALRPVWLHGYLVYLISLM